MLKNIIKKSIACSLLFTSILNAEDGSLPPPPPADGSLSYIVNLKFVKGWNILGLDNGIEKVEEQLSDPRISLVWTYRKGSWYAYSSHELKKANIIKSPNITYLSKINATEGFWVYTNHEFVLPIKTTVTSKDDEDNSDLNITHSTNPNNFTWSKVAHLATNNLAFNKIITNPDTEKGTLSPEKINEAIAKSKTKIVKITDESEKYALYIYDKAPILYDDQKEHGDHYWRSNASNVKCTTSFNSDITTNVWKNTVKEVSCDSKGIGTLQCGGSGGYLLWHDGHPWGDSPCKLELLPEDKAKGLSIPPLNKVYFME